MNQQWEELVDAEEVERYGKLSHILKEKAVEAGIPLWGTFELTPHCTLDCKMCYVHNSAGVYPERTLTGDEWIRIMDAAIDAGMLDATLTGGECFLHPDFRKIYTYLKKRGVIVSLLTNATLIDEETISWLKEFPPYCVQITVYGSNPRVYERVTGSAEAFYKVDRAIELLHEAGITVNLVLTISRFNFDDFEALYRYAKGKPHARMNMDCDLFQPNEATDRKLESFVLSMEEQEWLRRKCLELGGRSCTPVCEQDLQSAAQQASSIREYVDDSLPCVGGKCMFSVTYGGRMQPCTQLKIASVNLREEDFSNAWQMTRVAVEGYRRSEECRSCEFFGQCAFCAARYSLRSGGDGKALGAVPCNKKKSMLIPILMKKTKGENKDEKRV